MSGNLFLFQKSPDNLLALVPLDLACRRQVAVKQSGRLPRKDVFRFVILIALSGAALLLSVDRQAAAQTTKTWNTTSPNWHTASGWTSPGVPGTNDTALFDINTSDTVTWNATTGNRTAGRLDVFAGNYTFNNITATPFELSLTSPAFSPLRVLGTTTTLNINGLQINAMASNVLIDNAATVNVRVGSGPGIFSVGRITSSSFLRNNGTLNISLGSIVSNTSGSIASAPFSGGTTTVSGLGSTWNNSLSLRVGEGGFGTLNVLAGGVVTTGTPGLNGVIDTIGFSAGSTGTVTVSGAGSLWDNRADLEVGRSGTGILNIENGGVVSNFNGLIGVDPISNSTATVTGSGSLWDNSTFLVVGNLGTGTLNVENGGQVHSDIGSIAGAEESGGKAIVTGIGSEWISGLLEVGLSGIGSLNVENGGGVSTTSSAIGALPGSTGTATIQDVGSNWSSSFMRVGERGIGTLNVENGGTVSLINALNIGDRSTAFGIVTVTGNNSQIDTPDLFVGDEGEGSLVVENDASVFCEHITIASSVGSLGTLVVGSDGLLHSSGDVVVGQNGIGALRIEPAGQLIVDGELAISPFSQLEAFSGSLQVAGGVTNNGMLRLVFGANIVSDVVNNANILTVVNSDVLFDGDLLHIGAAIRTVGNSRTRIAGAAGGNGPYAGSGLVQFDGRFEPGVLGPGQILFEGNVQLATNAPLQIQLAGTGTSSFDRMLIEGSLTIEPQRTLEVSLINGFAIVPGQQFVIVEVGTTRNGQFAGLGGGSLVGNFGGTELFISYAGGDSNDIVLYTIGLIGDVNGDGIVSLLDVAPFVNALTSGPFDPEADINRDGVVDLLDVSPFVALLTG